MAPSTDFRPAKRRRSDTDPPLATPSENRVLAYGFRQDPRSDDELKYAVEDRIGRVRDIRRLAPDRFGQAKYSVTFFDAATTQKALALDTLQSGQVFCHISRITVTSPTPSYSELSSDQPPRQSRPRSCTPVAGLRSSGSDTSFPTNASSHRGPKQDAPTASRPVNIPPSSSFSSDRPITDDQMDIDPAPSPSSGVRASARAEMVSNSTSLSTSPARDRSASVPRRIRVTSQSSPRPAPSTQPAPSAPPATNPLPVLPSCVELNSDVTSLKVKLSTSMKEITDLRAKLADSEGTRMTLIKSAEGNTAKHLEAIDTYVKEAEQQFAHTAKLQDEVEALTKANKKLTDEYMLLRGDLTEVEKVSARRLAKIKTLTAAAAKAPKTAEADATLAKELAELRAAHGGCEQQIADHRANVERLQAEVGRVKALCQKARQQRDARPELKDHEAALAQITSLESDLSTLRSQHDEQLRAFASLKTQLADRNALITEQAAKIKELEATVAAERTTNATIHADAEKVAQDALAVRAVLQARNDQYTSLGNEHNDLVKKHKLVVQSVSDMQTSLEAQHQELTSSASQLQTALTKIKNLEKGRDNALHVFAKVRDGALKQDQELATAKTQLHDANEQLTAARAQYATMLAISSDQMKTADDAALKAMAEATQLKVDLIAKQKLLESSESAYSQSEAHVSRLAIELAQVRMENDERLEKIVQARDEAERSLAAAEARARADNDALRARCEEAEKAVRDGSNARRIIEDRRDALQNENATLSRQLRREKDELDRVSLELGAESNKVAQLHEAYARLEAEVDSRVAAQVNHKVELLASESDNPCFTPQILQAFLRLEEAHSRASGSGQSDRVPPVFATKKEEPVSPTLSTSMTALSLDSFGRAGSSSSTRFSPGEGTSFSAFITTSFQSPSA